MSISIIHGDIWSQPRGVLVHGCNAQGVMGKGAALGFKKKFPAAFAQYRKAWEEGKLKLGEVIFCELGPDLWGACAITQQHYGRGAVHADLRAIEKAFGKIAGFAADKGLPVSFIRVGAGLAGGDWNEIQPIIQRALGPRGGVLVEFGAPATPSQASEPGAQGDPAAQSATAQAAAPAGVRPAGAPPVGAGGLRGWGQKR